MEKESVAHDSDEISGEGVVDAFRMGYFRNSRGSVSIASLARLDVPRSISMLDRHRLCRRRVALLARVCGRQPLSSSVGGGDSSENRR